MAHLSLGTVLAYPAISLPQLTSLQPLSSSVPVYTSIPDQDMLTFYQSNDTAQQAIQYERSTVDYRETGELLTLQMNPKNNTVKKGDGSSSTWNFFSTIHLTSSQTAWFASAHTLGAIWGSMMCGFLMSIFGQRRAILIAAPVTLASWLSIWLAPFFSVMVTARLVSGLCIGVLGTAAQVYIVEVAHETVRGSLTCITDLFVGLGLLFTYILGISGLGWRWAAFTLGLVTNVPLIIGLSLFPDSPRWLATKDRKEEARKALKFLRGSSYDVSAELEKIMKAGSSRSKTTFTQQISKLKDPVVYAPFLTGCGVFFFSQLSGPYVVYSYTVHIFQVANAGLSPYLSTVLVGVARVAGSCIGIVVVERAGRRPAMLMGGVGASLSLICLGLYFFLQRGEGASSSGWLALVSMISFTIILGATISPIPFLLSSELLPLSFR
ncbi:facilitated trehalose transporter Tret1 [Penaeus vannamei]